MLVECDKSPPSNDSSNFKSASLTPNSKPKVPVSIECDKSSSKVLESKELPQKDFKRYDKSSSKVFESKEMELQEFANLAFSFNYSLCIDQFS